MLILPHFVVELIEKKRFGEVNNENFAKILAIQIKRVYLQRTN